MDPKKQKLVNKHQEMNRILGFMLIIFILLMVIMMVSSNPPSSTRGSSLGSSSPTCTTGRLYISGSNTIYLAVDKDDGLGNCMGDVDAEACLSDLLLSGKIFGASSNAEVSVIQRSGYSVKVTVKSGLNTGRSGWIPEEWFNCN